MKIKIGDYRVIAKGVFKDSKIFSFNLPSDMVESNPRRSILSFYTDPDKRAKKLRVRVYINGRSAGQVFSSTYKKGTGSSNIVVIPTGKLNAGVSNTIEFRVTTGRFGGGRMHFSNIILWYQRDIVV